MTKVKPISNQGIMSYRNKIRYDHNQQSNRFNTISLLHEKSRSDRSWWQKSWISIFRFKKSKIHRKHRDLCYRNYRKTYRECGIYCKTSPVWTTRRRCTNRDDGGWKEYGHGDLLQRSTGQTSTWARCTDADASMRCTQCTTRYQPCQCSFVFKRNITAVIDYRGLQSDIRYHTQISWCLQILWRQGYDHLRR